MAHMEFLKQVLPKDRECKITWHRLEKGVRIGPYSHPEEDEYMVGGQGKFTLIVNGEEIEHEFQDIINYVYIPKNTEHTIVNKGDTTDYFVIKIKK